MPPSTRPRCTYIIGPRTYYVKALFTNLRSIAGKFTISPTRSAQQKTLHPARGERFLPRHHPNSVAHVDRASPSSYAITVATGSPWRHGCADAGPAHRGPLGGSVDRAASSPWPRFPGDPHPVALVLLDALPLIIAPSRRKTIVRGGRISCPGVCDAHSAFFARRNLGAQHRPVVSDGSFRSVSSSAYAVPLLSDARIGLPIATRYYIDIAPQVEYPQVEYIDMTL